MERLVLHQVLLFPRDVERAVAAGAAQHSQPLAQRYTFSAIRADAVLGHAGKAGRVLGAGHDRPATRRLAQDLQVGARDADALAHDVHDRLARPQLLHVVPGTPTQRIIGLRTEPGPEASRSHLPLPLLPMVSAAPTSRVRVGWWRSGRPGDRVGAWWSMRVAIIALQPGGALRPLVCHPARRPPATLAGGPVVEVAAGVAHAELRGCLPLSDPKGLRRPCCGSRPGSVAFPPCRD